MGGTRVPGLRTSHTVRRQGQDGWSLFRELRDSVTAGVSPENTEKLFTENGGSMLEHYPFPT